MLGNCDVENVEEVEKQRHFDIHFHLVKNVE